MGIDSPRPLISVRIWLENGYGAVENALLLQITLRCVVDIVDTIVLMGVWLVMVVALRWRWVMGSRPVRSPVVFGQLAY